MDARKKKFLVVLVAGTCILAWRIYAVATKYGLPSLAGAASVTPTDSVATAPLGVAEEDMSPVLAAQSAVEKLPWGRNPFERPAVEKPREIEKPKPKLAPKPPPSPSAFKLTGVSKSGDQWLAAASGRILRIGDVLQGDFHVTKITSTSITLEAKGWAFEYVLGAAQPSVRPLGENP